jgi:hypothetical protein
MRRWLIWLGALVGLAMAGGASAAPCCGPITPEGQRLAHVLDGTDVEHLWLAGNRVDWQTGTPIAPSSASTTHCSAFAAAIAGRLGIYVLRPPQHPQTLLANAQMGWLREAGGGSGWRSLPDPTAAQAAANRGELVVEAFENPNPHRPGHIAIVRPSEQSADALERSGPRETQAGATNALDISTARGFAHHPGAWVAGGQGGIRYFAHTINWSALP